MSPVGASISKSMKMSFSLSSLQPSSNSLESPEHARMLADRPYNSLTKKRKDPEQEQWRRSWGSREDNKDDFWAAIQSNYNYIMDTNLIDSCKEANGELAWDEADVSTLSWGLKEVSCQFSELYSWLGAIQELVYSKEENLLDKSLRAAHTEELRRKAYRRRLFNEQAGKLVARAPTLRDEVAWRVDHLNTKWELVEQIMAPGTQPESNQQDVSADFEHEVKCLRKWLREMESRLQPLCFRVDWSRVELEEKAMEHMVLQRDIEAHGRIVSSVVKLSERVVSTAQQQQQQQQQQLPAQAVRVASSLERRWHLLFLRALEWQCHIETLASRICNKSLVSCRSSSDSDEEPVTKQPRLSRRQSRESGGSSSGQSGRSARLGRVIRSRVLRPRASDTAATKGDLSDSDVSSENRFNDDGLYFEDELHQLCAIDMDSSGNLENPEQVVPNSTGLGDQGEEGDVEESGVSEEERDDMPPTPVVMPMTTTPIDDDVCDEVDGGRTVKDRIKSEASNGVLAENNSPKRRRAMEEAASFNTSNRKSKNCATFYFKHLDTDSEVDYRVENESPNAGDSSEEEWTYTASRLDDQLVTCERRKTNVVVRLDFGEKAQVERSESIQFVPNDSLVNGGRVDDNGESRKCTDASDERMKDSEDEMANDKMSIQRLIREVEKLVREEGTTGTAIRDFPPLIFEEKGMSSNNRAKHARIKEWLKLNPIRTHEGKSMSQYWLQPMDSCDASGEYTTGESDVEKQSVSSDDPHSSVVTFRRFNGSLGCVSQSISQEIINDMDKTPVNDSHHQPMLESSTPKVVMRSKRKSNGPRPWSVSCISQIGNGSNMKQTNDPISQFSISESALHQLIRAPPTKSVSLDATGSHIPFNNSSLTLLEETMIDRDGGVVRNSSLRRKKSKLRKKNLCRKSESGSDGVNANHYSAGSDGCSIQLRSPRRTSMTNRGICTISRDCHGRLTTLVKSGSFSGCTARQQLSLERAIVSDPTPPVRLRHSRCDASTSETEDEDRVVTKGCPAYENNLLGTVLKSKELLNGQFNVDSDVEKNSLSNNSFSEQAWDNYQEKYMSEPYSEAPDLEAARRLLDFGDDYRNFLDSQSDCASSMGAIRDNTPPMPKKRMHHGVANKIADSDSDSEDLFRLIEKSQSQLLLSENLFLRSNGSLLLEDCIEVEATCRENARCLRSVLEAAGGALWREKNSKQIRGLIERWESLSTRAEEARRATTLHRDLTAMRLEFRAIHDRLFSYEIVLDQQHVLDEQINKVTSELATLRERKTTLLALNVSTHRLITDAGASAPPTFAALKDEVADLYRVWDETFQRGNQQLSALQAVQQFGTRLTELQSALRRDKDTLAVLDAALQAGATSEVASSVRDVARLLSEKQDICCQNGSVVNGSSKEDVSGTTTPSIGSAMVIGALSQEGGSLSDSGISDSGSEQELSERERRLAVLRRLARTLEAQLAPGSEALVELSKRIEGAEKELRGLQKQCRELIVRTAACVEARAANRTRGQVNSSPANKRKKGSKSNMDVDATTESQPAATENSGLTDGGDPDNEPGRPHGWVWRVLRAALPFQLALVALFCAACLLEPHCCEAANTLNLSLTPQLRYVRGPPPV